MWGGVVQTRHNGGGSSSDDCAHGGEYPWVWKYLGECVHNSTQLAAVFLGLSSIAFWLVAQAPYVGAVSCRGGVQQGSWTEGRQRQRQRQGEALRS